MAQKPNFLKKLISAGLVTASTATIVAGFAGSAMGAANRNIDANVNLNAVGIPGIVTGDSLTYVVQAGGPFTATADGGNDNGGNPTVLCGSINMLQSGVFAVNGTNIAIGAVSGAAGQLLTVNITSGHTLTLNGAPGVAAFPINTYTNLGPINFADANSVFQISLAANGADGTKTAVFGNTATFNGTAAGKGHINIDNGSIVIFNGTIGNTNGIQGFILGANAQVTLNANAKLDGIVGADGIILGNAAVLNVADGVNITGITAANNIDIGGAGANNGTVNFLGDSTVSTDIGANNPVAAVNVAGELTFQGGNNGNGGTFAAQAINLTSADSLIKFTTQDHNVVGNILNTSGTNNQGGFSVNGGNVTVTGNIGANGNSLATINFETDNTLVVHKAAANATNALFVQNVSTATANKGILELRGTNFAINGNIGGNNALKIVTLADDDNGAATNFTLKQGSKINAQNIYLSKAFDNTLTLEEGTTVNGDIINMLAAGNGTIALTGNATINGNIGVDAAVGGNVGNALKNINLAGKNLSYGGNSVLLVNNPANAITFGANETLTLTNTTDAALQIKANLAVTTDKQGILDASSLTNDQTLTISGNIGAIAPGANKILGQLRVGSSKTILNAGDVAINELDIGNNGSVQLGHNTYLITKTTNAAGQGKIIVAGDPAAPITTLSAGTNLGSAANSLAEINFAAPIAPNDSVLEVGKGVNLYATNITTAAADTGSFSFTAGGTNIVSGIVGGQQGNKFNTVELDNGTTAQFLGSAIFSGKSTIVGNSTLQIGGNYTTSFIESADNTGIVEFVNADDITVTLQTQAAAVDVLKQITVSGPGRVVFNENGNLAGHGVNTTKIAFANASLGVGLFLPSKISFDGLTITSTVGNGPVGDLNVPAVIVSDVDSTIAPGQAIGDQNNVVGLGLASDDTITVDANTLYAGLFTVNDGQGIIQLNGGVPNTPGTIYGLGIKPEDEAALKLKLVTVTTNYKNLGNTFVNNLIVNDGLTYQAGGVAGKNFDGTITLGSANGNSNVIFADGTNSTSTSTVATVKANNGVVTYLGSASVGNIGSSNTPVASVQFTGPAGSLEKLQGNIYSTATNFGNVNLNVAASNVILGGGTTAINGNIDLATNTLTFASGTSTWGGNTSLSTMLTVANGSIGHIVIAEGVQVNATTTGTTIINVQDSANANFSGIQTYTLIQGGVRFAGTLGDPKFNVTGSNIFVKYGLIRADNKDYVLTRTNDVANVVTKAIGSSQFAGVVDIGQNVTTFVNATNTAAYNNLLLAKNTTDAANFVGAITTDTSAAVTNAQLDVAKDIQAQLGNRLGALRYLGTYETPEMAGAEGGLASTPQGPVAAGDEAVDNVAYGIWAKPFYTDAYQSKKGGLAGYKAKTTGVVIGLDTLANDNLMIGAAIGITKTDIKHQDYKKGDKTDINSFSFSLYGAQQLVENFFAQGSAIFSLNQVKNKHQRYFFDANGNMSKQIAAGNYDNMIFGGNLTVGYDYNAMEGVLVTPMAGLSYLKSSDENYKETGTTVANKQVNSKFSDRTDLIVGAKVMGNTMNFSDLAVYPEAHAFVVHKVNGRLSKIQSQLDGQVTPFISQPDRTAKTSYNLGLSVSIRPGAKKMEYGIGYDAQIASKYTAHQGTLKVRVNF
ncbi:MAG: autotransporter outer membrane beta-barrel domain-containing protein [Rickettsia endosymbiont of Ixodes persulcatus]|nr:autotransporter outer membrane beta-barrel domain-containing protein [Rickettsia endosymbiont of Ixodes persulcatus]MCZ6903828.1 autotransporter outer membrane beta-barrel domain-containing protein [Rickettsia endosymbiont of Ixodes persulcatus]MCZ6909962.1 autotransporter outer membrane beta-barrel domain-containing protein [Rickettsia endosymbiont of Ixodes persulcatus]MCZ6914148.1 autotransporter outer membrane beta-barrel domain-containing protein [Rickettsia endosymbiont of Ixodes persul